MILAENKILRKGKIRMANPQILAIRAKKLGVLIRDARLASGKSIDECARVTGVPSSTFEAYELGDQSPSLPELEVLAYYLNTPLEHFWGKKSLSEEKPAITKLNLEQLISLRQRMIGALIRQTRLQAGISTEAMADKLEITSSQLEAYEFGDAPIPIPLLDGITAVLSQPVESYQDRNGPVGAWIAQNNVTRDFLNLPPELRSFVSKPVNRPYLQLAQRLSEMSVEKLRAVAEGLLEITL